MDLFNSYDMQRIFLRRFAINKPKYAKIYPESNRPRTTAFHFKNPDEMLFEEINEKHVRHCMQDQHVNFIKGDSTIKNNILVSPTEK